MTGHLIADARRHWQAYLDNLEDDAAGVALGRQRLAVAIQAFEQVRRTFPADHEDWVDIAWCLSLALTEHYVSTRDSTQLARAITLVDEVLRMADFGRPGEGDGADEGLVRHQLGTLLLERFGEDAQGRARALAELERATWLERTRPVEPPARPAWYWSAVQHIGLIRTGQWRSGRHDADLQAAIRELTELVDGPVGSDLAAAIVAELAQLLYERGGKSVAAGGGSPTGPADLAAAVDRYREAARRGTPADLAWPDITAGAALTGWSNYSQTHDLDFLAEVETWAAAAVASSPPDRRDAAVTLRGLVLAELSVRGRPSTAPDAGAVLRQSVSLLVGEINRQVREGNPFVDSSRQPESRVLFPVEQTASRMAMAFGAYEALAADDPARPDMAGMLAVLEFMAYQRGECDLNVERSIGMIEIALAGPRSTPERRQSMLTLLGSVHCAGGFRGDDGHVDAAIEALRKAQSIPEADPRVRAEIDALMSSALHLRAIRRGGLADLEQASSHSDQLAGSPELLPWQRVTFGAQAATIRAVQAYQRRDVAALDDAVAELSGYLDNLDQDDARRGLIAANLAVAKMYQAGLRTGPGSPEAAARAADLARQAADMPGLSPSERAAVAGQAGIHWAAAAIAAHDLAGLGGAITMLQDAVAGLPASDPVEARLRSSLAASYACRGEVTRSRSDIERAVVEFERVSSAIDDVTEPIWPTAAIGLGQSLRLRASRGHDDLRRSREMGLAALRGHAWQVLVQSGTEHATDAGRSAANDAVEVAGWCVADDDAEAAAVALDAGRGLVLHAAVTDTTVAAQLRRRGAPALADAWETAIRTESAENIPSDLRREVMRGLVFDGSTRPGRSRNLLDPPTAEEVRTALLAGGAQALVYLVPATDECPAAAVVIPARGGPAIVRLPALGGPSPDAGRPGSRRREAGPADLGDGRPAVVSNEELNRRSAWAWSGAMGPVLAFCADRGLTRPYRLVLVPMGDLGLVAWHAARAPSGRYAIESATVSYAVSARLYCEAMRRDQVSVVGPTLIVGDPDGTLMHAGEEARAIRDTIYAHAAYLDRGTTDASTALLRWLAEAAGGDRGVLHLACHGSVAPGSRASSYLKLTGGQCLSAEQIIDSAGRNTSYRLAVVVLAACSTGVSGRGYDEAFSLATTFLAVGARSVIGSLWPVPDESTSLLMYMFHHFLGVERVGPAAALRRAQLWMLDRGRHVPNTMPASMRARAAALDAEDLTAWAGFAHYGQW